MQHVLLISPTWVNIQQDIQQELEAQGYAVEFIPEYSFREDPLKVQKFRNRLPEDEADRLKTEYWKKHLGQTDTRFDVLFVVDGQGVNQYVFDLLKQRNPDLYAVNYLYDVTYSVYHFERNFGIYNKVYSFDRKDCSQYGLSFLPIYWVPLKEIRTEQQYSIFGFGGYSENRYNLYRQISRVAEQMQRSHFVKVYHPEIKSLLLYRLKLAVRALLGMPRLISPEVYSSDLTSSAIIPTDVFRELVYRSDVVVDTKVFNQDGLTARFMWALGYGKKIITTNDSVKTYDFYDENQILVVEDKEFTPAEVETIKQFINSNFSVSPEKRQLIEQYTLTRWVKTCLGIPTTNG